MKRAHAPYRLGRLAERVFLSISRARIRFSAAFARAPERHRRGQIVDQPRTGYHGARAGAAAAVRLGERLVQIGVYHVEAQISELHPADDGVQIGAVAVNYAAGVADDARDVENVGIEQAERAGERYHQPGEVVVHGRAEGVQVGVAVGVGRQRHHAKARHRRRRRVCAVRGVGYQDVLAPRVAAL